MYGGILCWLMEGLLGFQFYSLILIYVSLHDFHQMDKRGKGLLHHESSM